MEEFKKLEALWQVNEPKAPIVKSDFLKIKSNRMKLRGTYTTGAALLIVTGLLLLAMLSFFDEGIGSALLVGSLIFLAVTCFLQAALMICTAVKIMRINEALPPGLHLKQWLQFRAFQKKQRHWNMPVYYLLLSLAIGLYMYELLKNVEIWKWALALGITYAWMLFAYFYLGKKELQKQDAKMDGIILELKKLEDQFR